MKRKDYLLDTNVVRYLYELRAGVKSQECLMLKRRMDSLLDGDKILLSPITVGEVSYGTRVGPFQDAQSEKSASLMQILQNYECCTIDFNVAHDCYSELRARLYRAYAPKQRKEKRKRVEEWIDPATSRELQVQENDVWITAIAWTYNLVLVTDDSMEPIRRIADSDIEFENWIREDANPKHERAS